MKSDAPCIILNAPQLAENIGAVARVMANFGLADLRLIRPRDGWPQPRAWVNAAGAHWPLDNAQVFETLEAAIGDLNLILATTARPRETHLAVITAREGAAELKSAIDSGLKVGLMFGPERAGLETADIALSHAIITLPVDPQFQSLNLAQAVAITAYEWRLTQAPGAPVTFRENPPPAEQSAVIGFYEQLDAELETAGFFHPPEKRASMQRNLRVAFGRAQLSDQEVRTLRGVVTALAKGRGRVLAKLAAAKAAKS